jgi:hypothetical protein
MPANLGTAPDDREKGAVMKAGTKASRAEYKRLVGWLRMRGLSDVVIDGFLERIGAADAKAIEPENESNNIVLDAMLDEIEHHIERHLHGQDKIDFWGMLA